LGDKRNKKIKKLGDKRNKKKRLGGKRNKKIRYKSAIKK